MLTSITTVFHSRRRLPMSSLLATTIVTIFLLLAGAASPVNGNSITSGAINFDCVPDTMRKVPKKAIRRFKRRQGIKDSWNLQFTILNKCDNTIIFPDGNIVVSLDNLEPYDTMASSGNAKCYKEDILQDDCGEPTVFIGQHDDTSRIQLNTDDNGVTESIILRSTQDDDTASKQVLYPVTERLGKKWIGIKLFAYVPSSALDIDNVYSQYKLQSIEIPDETGDDEANDVRRLVSSSLRHRTAGSKSDIFVDSPAAGSSNTTTITYPLYYPQQVPLNDDDSDILLSPSISVGGNVTAAASAAAAGIVTTTPRWRSLQSQTVQRQSQRQLNHESCTDDNSREIELAVAVDSTFCQDVGGTSKARSVVNRIITDVTEEFEISGLCWKVTISHYEEVSSSILHLSILLRVHLYLLTALFK